MLTRARHVRPACARRATVALPHRTPLCSVAPPRRNASMMMGPWGLKFLAGGALAVSYLALQTLIRTRGSQRRAILRTLERGAIVHATSREMKLERPLELAALSNYLEVPHGLLTALTGPDSSGKSALLRSAIAGRAMTTFLDLRQFPVTSDEEFISAFLVSFGYRLPSNDILRRWLLRERQPKQAMKIQPEEVDLAFERLTEVLLAEKSRRAHDNAERRLPILIVSGVEALDAPGLHPEGGHSTAPLPKSEKGKDKDKGKNKSGGTPDVTFLSKFMNYAIYVTDAGLARVIVITSRFFLLDVLDQLLDITYPPAPAVQKYLLGPVNTHLTRIDEAKKTTHGVKRVLSPEEAKHVAESLGGCLTDINYLISCVVRGLRPAPVVARLVADAANQTADFLESILHAAAVAGKEAKAEQERYEQVWEMMELLVSKPFVPRSDLVAIFSDDPTYLDKLEAARLVLFLENALVNEEAENIPVASVDGKPTWQAKATAGVPRLVPAWRLLLSDPRMQEQRAVVKAAVKKSKMKGDRKDIQDNLQAIALSRRDTVSELEMLAANEQALRGAYGSRYEEQRGRVVTRLDDLWKRSTDLEREMVEMDEALEELKDAKKALKKKEKKNQEAIVTKDASTAASGTASTDEKPVEASVQKS